MKFFTDQDVYLVTVSLLREWGHDVITAKELGMSRASDEELLIKAKEIKRIFVTRDKDFGALVFLKQISNGVILLRMTPANIDKVHKELEYMLSKYTQDSLYKLFIVIESDRFRVRPI